MNAADLLQGGSESDDGGAEQAFEALRAEVVAMRQQLELVHRQGEQTRDASAALTPDYTLTLGKMEKTLGVIAARLTTVEQQPALQMSGAQLRSEMGAATQTASSMMVRAMVEPLEAMRIATAKMEGMVGKARDQVEQRKWLWTAAIGGAVGGACLWVVLAAVLPWGVGDRMAALPITGGDRWAAGQAFLNRSNPPAWERMVKLFNACGDQSMELCEAAIVVRTMPPVGQEGKAPSSASPQIPAPRPVARPPSR
ncbi:MAG: DUF6118 family protein [Janthinobacterium lividum]